MTFNPKRISISKARSEIVEMMDSSTRSFNCETRDRGAGSMMRRKKPRFLSSLFRSIFFPLRVHLAVKFSLDREVTIGRPTWSPLFDRFVVVQLRLCRVTVTMETMVNGWRHRAASADFPRLFVFKFRLLEHHRASNDFVDQLRAFIM